MLPLLNNVFTAAVVMCRDHTEAQDLTQTTYLKAMESFETFRPAPTPRPGCCESFATRG